GKVDRNGLSLLSTPSPSRLLGALLNWGVNGVAPARARSSMSVTSSARRRPFGNPALSPPSTPSGFGLADGGRAVFRRRYSAGFPLGTMLRLGMPVRKIETKSLRGAGGTVTPG